MSRVVGVHAGGGPGFSTGCGRPGAAHRPVASVSALWTINFEPSGTLFAGMEATRST